MNAKERVNLVFQGQIPDRVPIGEFAIDFDTVEKIIGHETYLRAKAKSRIAFWEGRHADVAESYRKDHIEFHEKLPIDIINFPMATWKIPPETDDPPPRRIDATTWEDKYGRIYKFSEITQDIVCMADPTAAGNFYSIDGDPLATMTEVQAGVPPQPARDERSWQILDAVIRHFRERKFIAGPSGGEIGMVLLGRMEQGMMAMVEQPELIAQAAAYLVQKQNLADAVWVHPDADAISWGADFGFKSGPFISPRLFKRLFLAPNKARVDHIHGVYKKYVVKHCCGNIQALLDFFVEIGYDCYQSIQTSAGMDLAHVKQHYGDKLVLWGGVALEHLVSGTMAEVREDVRHALEIGKRGGRFILGSSHSIAVGTNYDNFMAMLDEYQQHCEY